MNWRSHVYPDATTATTLKIGAHVEQEDPVAAALARGASLSQFFLGDPQGYKGPEIRYAGGAEALREAAEEAGVDLYVHAPYIINVATTNNRIRIPSRKLLQQHMDAAASLGAKGLIVHGGHVDKAGDDAELLAKGFDNWRKAIEATDIKIPLLIENTAGGTNAMARHLDRIGRVWDAISAAEGSGLDALRDAVIEALSADFAHAEVETAAGTMANRPCAFNRARISTSSSRGHSRYPPIASNRSRRRNKP